MCLCLGCGGVCGVRGIGGEWVGGGGVVFGHDLEEWSGVMLCMC